MSLTSIIAIAVVLLILLVFILFPEARSLFSGFTRLFIKDMATTPEGARAIYEEKIEQARQAYNKADSSYKKAAGKYESTKRVNAELAERLKQVEKECEALVRANNLEAAALKAEEREEIISEQNRTKQLLVAYEKAVASAKEAYTECEKRLKALKRESKEVVENMKVKEQLKEVYDDVDELKAVTGTDKMIDAIREKNKDLDEVVEGSRVVHNSKLSTRTQKAEEAARKASTNDYLESLKKKYNK